MGKRKSVKEKLKHFRKKLVRNFKLNKMLLFGSRANGKIKKDSDIDLIIVSPEFVDMDFFQRGAKMYDYWDLDYPVDFLCYTPEEFEKLKRQISIVREALNSGVEIK